MQRRDSPATATPKGHPPRPTQKAKGAVLVLRSGTLKLRRKGPQCPCMKLCTAPLSRARVVAGMAWPGMGNVVLRLPPLEICASVAGK